jgi:hypothetical protein
MLFSFSSLPLSTCKPDSNSISVRNEQRLRGIRGRGGSGCGRMYADAADGSREIVFDMRRKGRRRRK